MKRNPPPKQPRRCEVWLVNFDPTIGVEIKKTRPALVIQNDAGNIASQATIVAAITSAKRKPYHFEVMVKAPEGGLNSDSLILLQQIRTIDKQRLVQPLGKITRQSEQQVETALRISLGLS